MAKKRPGRPALADGEALEDTIRIRVTRSEKRRIAREAEQNDESLSSWCRRKLLDGNAQ